MIHKNSYGCFVFLTVGKSTSDHSKLEDVSNLLETDLWQGGGGGKSNPFVMSTVNKIIDSARRLNFLRGFIRSEKKPRNPESKRQLVLTWTIFFFSF